MKEIRFDGRVAVITGAGNGLGRSHALFFASRGAKVVVNDLGGTVAGTGGSHTAADAVVNEIVAAGGRAVANYDSVATEEGGRNIVKTALDAFGTVDILVNNAGNVRDKTLAKMDLADFRALVDVHLMGAVYCTHAAWPTMREKNFGRIVMTTSGAGLYGNHGHTNYGAAKMALIGFMNALKEEGRKHNITVHAIAPIASTRMTATVTAPKVARLIKPEFVTAAVAWMCAPENEETGHIIEAGAGYYAKVEVREAQGAVFGTDAIPTPEQIRDRYSEISDMSQAAPYLNASDVLRKIFRLVAPRE
ncbi:MAG: SDR family NAD(P)-dependent oxidoreductase [Deltaproteobacteria bacterium]|nr:SDR family NAD(P)-dependent oxidoreductase [Deltaproteobacteria bacterium]